MPNVLLRHPAALSNSQSANCYSEGQRYFWVASKGDDGDYDRFYNIGKHLAKYPLVANVDLPYGRYVLGCGYGRCRLRRVFDVTLLGVQFK